MMEVHVIGVTIVDTSVGVGLFMRRGRLSDPTFGPQASMNTLTDQRLKIINSLFVARCVESFMCLLSQADTWDQSKYIVTFAL